MGPRSTSRFRSAAALAATLAAALAATLALAACEVTDDPRRGGLVSGIWGLSTGAYDERLEERETRLEAERRSNEDLERDLEDLQREEARLAAQKDVFNATMVRLARKLHDLEAELRAFERSESADRAKVMELEADIRDLERRHREAGLASEEDDRREFDELLSIDQELLELEKALNSAVASSVGVED